MKPRFNNQARPEGARSSRPYYLWKVFVDEPPGVLATIAEVEYILHPTLPEPVRVSKDRGDRFAISSSGWGEFDIAIRLTYVDGRQEDTVYSLDLNKGWPQQDQAASLTT